MNPETVDAGTLGRLDAETIFGLLSQAMPADVEIDLRAPDGAAPIRMRAVEATLACIARHGLSKLTVDDVAREAGCGRASLYREFGSKRALVAAVVSVETERMVGAVTRAATDADTLEDAVVAMLTTAGREVETHAALQFVAAFEPELLLPHLTFAGADRFLAWTSARLSPCFERFLAPADTVPTAEWIARVALVLWCSPTASSAPVVLGDPTSVRPFVQQFVLPGIRPRLPARG
jgi:AcrR family transcriptional regulator